MRPSSPGQCALPGNINTARLTSTNAGKAGSVQAMRVSLGVLSTLVPLLTRTAVLYSEYWVLGLSSEGKNQSGQVRAGGSSLPSSWTEVTSVSTVVKVVLRLSETFL